MATAGNNTAGRSIRWRFQLGLLPSLEDENNLELLIQERHDTFLQWVAEFPFPIKEEETTKDDLVNVELQQQPKTAVDIDPLTAMLQEQEQAAEMDREYQRETARRKRGLGGSQIKAGHVEDESYDERAATLQIIDKDLDRLPSPYQSQEAQHNVYRKRLLRRLLFVYHCRHGPETPGYRQGMHEIASHVLYAIELDQNDCCGKASFEDNTVSMEASECYFVLEKILSAILPAYDVALPTSDMPHEKPLEGMARRVLTLVARADAQLWQRLVDLSLPPAIYLTKWIRLLFSREVVDYTTVWDAFFELVSQNQHDLLAVLEATAAARLLQHRVSICQAEEGIHLLMNLPTETTMEPILELAVPLLMGQTLRLPPVVMTQLQPPLTSRQQQFQHSPRHQNGLGFRGFSLSKMTENLATKAESFGQRIYQEWESIAQERDEYIQQNQQHVHPQQFGFGYQQQQQQQQRGNYHPAVASSLAAAASSGSRAAAAHPLAASGNATPVAVAPPAPPSLHSPQDLALHMESKIRVLQDFFMTLERQQQQPQQQQGRVVPNHVWEAMADLELVRQQLMEL